MTLSLGLARSALDRAIRALSREGIEEASAEARVLLAAALGVRLSQLDLHLGRPLPPDVARRLDGLVRRRLVREPLAYVTGDTEFMGLRFACDRRALVPRPETEILVEEVHRRLAGQEGPALVLDVGTGTGCIGLSLLAMLPGLRAVLTDASEAALSLARENAEALGVIGRARFLCGKELAPVIEAGLAGEVTCLVSNPPYVAPRDLPQLPPEVAEHEPREAWAGEGEEGIGLYERTVPACRAALPRVRLVGFEVGIGQATAVADLCRRAWPQFAVAVVCDLNGIERVVIAEAKDE